MRLIDHHVVNHSKFVVVFSYISLCPPGGLQPEEVLQLLFSSCSGSHFLQTPPLACSTPSSVSSVFLRPNRQNKSCSWTFPWVLFLNVTLLQRCSQARVRFRHIMVWKSCFIPRLWLFWFSVETFPVLFWRVYPRSSCCDIPLPVFVFSLHFFLCTLVFHAFIRPLCLYLRLTFYFLPSSVFLTLFTPHLCSVS